MITILKKIFGFGPKTDLSEIIRSGATIIDVRSKNEYASGHVKGSVNIPLGQLRQQLKKLEGKEPIITCCASGARSASALSILKAGGFKEVHNGGSWTSVRAWANKATGK